MHVTTTKPRKRWHQRWAVRIPLAFVALLILAGLTGYQPESAPQETTASAPVAEGPAPAPAVEVPAEAPAAPAPAPVEEPAAPAAAPAVGSGEWLLASLREQDPGFATAKDEVLIDLADKMCDYRDANGPSGAALAWIAQESGFTAHQAEVLSTSTYVYCTAQH